MDTVIVAFENPAAGKQFCSLIESSGTARCVLCRSGDQIRRLLSRQTCYCVVCSPHLPDGPAEWLFEDLPPICSLLLVGPQHMLDACDSPEIYKLATPLPREEALSTVRLLLQFGHRLEKYVRPRRTSAEQELVNRAKNLLIQRKGLTEEEAHRSIQKRAMDSGLRAAEAARQILRDLGVQP